VIFVLHFLALSFLVLQKLIRKLGKLNPLVEDAVCIMVPCFSATLRFGAHRNVRRNITLGFESHCLIRIPLVSRYVTLFFKLAGQKDVFATTCIVRGKFSVKAEATGD
jgi:hypothetical protein